MQILDRIPVASPAGQEPATPPESQHGQRPPEEFSRMMQQALAAKPKNSLPANAPLAEKAVAATPAGAEPVPANASAKKSAGQAATAKPAAKSVSLAPPLANDPAGSPAAALILPVPELPAALPVGAFGPLPGSEFPLPTSAPFSNSGNNNSTATVATVVPAVAGTGGAMATQEILKPGQAKDLAAEKNTPELSSAKPPADASSPKSEPAKPAAALVKNAVPAADNISAVPEVPPPAVAVEPAANGALAHPAPGLPAAAPQPAAPADDGTGVATLNLPMKNSHKTNNVAGLAGKVLPGDAAGPGAGKVLPPLPLAAPVRVTDGGSTDSNIIPPISAAVATADFSAAPAAAVPAFMEARMRTLERTHDMVALHAVRLVEGQTDSLSVVLKPGAGTELSLQLRQRDGGIEATAVLQRGDFQLMNQHWPELQQRLEQRGIKLAPLGSEADFSADSGSGFKQQQQASQEAEAQKASAFAEFALAGRALGATARLAVGVSGWESWA